MSKLLMVRGSSGSGKTTVANFAEQELGAERFGIDDYIRDLLRSADYRSSPLHDVLKDPGIQKRFWTGRGVVTYSWDSAMRLVDKYGEQLRKAYLDATDYDRRFIGCALLEKYFSDMERSLLDGRNAVQEAGPGVKPTFERAPADEKYILKLNVAPEIAVQRKVNQRGWDEERAAKIVAKTHRPQYVPDIPVERHWERDNNTEQDMEKIKADLRSLF